MKIACFSVKPYDRDALLKANAVYQHELQFFDANLTSMTAVLADGSAGVCLFVNDLLDAALLERLAASGTKMIATRSAGYNQIDLAATARLGLVVSRVPAYSPNAVSEFTVGLILILARQLHRAYNRVRENNFELTGLVGFELRDKTIGIFGTGKIGLQTIKNLSGFGARILAFDKFRNPEAEPFATYVDAETIARESDILSFHCPLTPETFHIINQDTLPNLKDGVLLVNTSRGALLDTATVIAGLKSGKIGGLAIDVYEEETELFYHDLSDKVITDDVFARLTTFPNVIVTGHMAFLTDHALRNIAETTLRNFAEFEQTGTCTDRVLPAGE